MRYWIRYSVVWLILLLAGSASFAQQSTFYQIKKRVMDGGGASNSMNTSFITKYTIGQSIIGKVNSTIFKSNLGFLNESSTILAPSNPPTDIIISSDSINENLPDSTIVAVLSTVDPDLGESHIYTFSSGTGGEDNSSFYLSGNTLLSTFSYNFESKGLYNIRLKTDDGHNGTFIKNFTIYIKNLNDPPSSVSVSDTTINEHLPVNTSVTILTVSDEDTWDFHSWALIPGSGGEDNTSFAISGNQLLSSEVFSISIKSSYHILIQVKDSKGDSLAKAFIIYITHENNIPYAIVISDSIIFENLPAPVFIGELSAYDPDTEDTLTFSLVSGAGSQNNNLFRVSGDSLYSMSTFNYESVNSYSIRIEVNDGKGGIYSRPVNILVINANDIPRNISLTNSSEFEGLPIGTSIGIFSAFDEDAFDTLIWSMVSGTGSNDNDQFSISGNQLETGVVFDYEADSIYTILVRCTDKFGADTTAGFTIHIKDVDEIPPVITNTNYPQFYEKGSGNKYLQITARDNKAIIRVSLFHKNVGGISWIETDISLMTSPVFTYQFNESLLDKMGMDFRFELYDAANNKVADSGVVYLSFPQISDSPGIPDLKFGGTISTYQIIAIPYELNDNSVSIIFRDYMPYDKNKWRILTFNNSTDSYIEYDQFNSIKIGAGYWFNAVKSIEISIGPGNAPQYNKDNPYAMNIKMGWNLIGNPYPFPVSWVSVINANSAVGMLGEPKSTDNGVTYLNLAQIPAFRGAFVNAANDMTILIPPLNSDMAGGRQENETDLLKNPIDADSWRVMFDFEVSGYTYSLGGFGMHPDASLGNDRYDDFTAPRFVNYVEINFQHKTVVKNDVTRDIVPLESNHIWEFKAETSFGTEATLRWDNPYLGDNDRELILYDVENQAIIDMKMIREYSFNPTQGNLFRIYYGNSQFIENELKPDRNLLSLPYPNPFTNETEISFSINKYDTLISVDISIYNLQGEKIKTLANGTFSGGFYTTIWDGQGHPGKRVAPGMYICVMSLPGRNSGLTFTRKIIFQ